MLSHVQFGVSQSAPVTSEAGEIGSAWSFTGTTMEQYQASVMRRSRTQVVSGINTSAAVGKFTAVATELHKPDVNLTISVSLH
jgi:hypothetical protein